MSYRGASFHLTEQKEHNIREKERKERKERAQIDRERERESKKLQGNECAN